MTASELFAIGRGVAIARGPHRCYYCSAWCNNSTPASSHVKKTFTARDAVGLGGYVCDGCVEGMNEKATIELITGEQRTGQKVRNYSWVLCKEKATAATKSNREQLLGVCLYPPSPPFSIVISDSGQKHLLYLGIVCHGEMPVTITLEGEPITYRPDSLKEKLMACKQVAAVVGQPGLASDLSPACLARIIEYHDDESLADRWLSIREHPVTRLAIWFTPAKKECEIEYPAVTGRTESRAIQAEISWAD